MKICKITSKKTKTEKTSKTCFLFGLAVNTGKIAALKPYKLGRCQKNCNTRPAFSNTLPSFSNTRPSFSNTGRAIFWSSILDLNSDVHLHRSLNAAPFRLISVLGIKTALFFAKIKGLASLMPGRQRSLLFQLPS